LQLVRQNAEIFYFSRKKECDFVIKQGVDITGAIQVCYALNHDNYEREVNGLLEAVNEFHLSCGLLLVHESEIKQEDLPQNIQLINVWRWLMKNEK